MLTRPFLQGLLFFFVRTLQLHGNAWRIGRNAERSLESVRADTTSQIDATSAGGHFDAEDEALAAANMSEITAATNHHRLDPVKVWMTLPYTRRIGAHVGFVLLTACSLAGCAT